MSKIYRVGIYCRLSVDDASNSAKVGTFIPDDESVSIENQRELLSKFVMLNGWIETKTYVDDGFSGGNFQRPGFLEMLKDAEKGIINLILVKDLSRLGRDYVEVGRYTDVVFPSLGCRFVSVLDCLDSESDNTDMLHFRSLMNDYHLRDLSNKVRSVLYSKKVNGQYIATFAPFGYRKSDTDKGRLVIDEYAAEIVRRIFDMRQSGTAYGKIASALNQEGIVSPRLYWYQIAGKDGHGINQLWTDTTVKIILRNEIYCGTLIMNRRGTRSYKDCTRVFKPESEWIRIEGAHEAIIQPDVWQAVQKINDKAKSRSKRNYFPAPKLFSGKLVCTDCKSHLCAVTETHRRKNGTIKRYVSYACSTYSRSGRSICSWHRIYEQTLSQIILAEIKTHVQAITLDETAVVKKLQRRIDGYSEQRLMDVRQEIKQLRHQIEELTDLTAKLYEDKISGAINGDTFAMLMCKNEQERISREERLNVLLSKVDKAEQEIDAIHNWTALIRKYVGLQELDRAVVDELIDHIEIGERSVVDGQRQQDIKVFYRFVGLVD